MVLLHLVAPQLVHHVRQLEHSARRVDCYQHVSPSPEIPEVIWEVFSGRKCWNMYREEHLRIMLILNLIREGK